MHQFLEAATIALSAIWSNKLRSFLTVLGNIVAVTSIIAVVSLVQGLNAAAKDVIQSQVGADTFQVSRTTATLTRQQADKAASIRVSRSTKPRRCASTAATSDPSWL